MDTENRYLRLLIISHNPFSMTSNNGKTLSSIFRGWPMDSIAQLFFRNEVPDQTTCRRFFLVTDTDVAFGARKRIGRMISSNGEMESRAENTADKGATIKLPRTQSMLLLRNIFWSAGRWDNARFRSWVNEFGPEAIFLVGGDSVFAYWIAARISSRYSVPIYLYYTDDYITPYPTLNPVWWLNWIWLITSLRVLLSRVAGIYVIGDDMAKEYQKRLGVPCTILMNAIDTEQYRAYRREGAGKVNDDRYLTLAYFGGLHLNRWRTLSKIAEACDLVMNKHEIGIELLVFSKSELHPAFRKKLDECRSIRFMGSIDESQIGIAMQKCDVLVHVESFEKSIRQRVRLSVSTKIPEYLASGKPILAVGPPDISSIRYLQQLGVAYVSDSPNLDQLERVLLSMVRGRSQRSEMGRRGVAVAESSHSIARNQEIIRRDLCTI